MGQFWDVINVDRRESGLTTGGKLGEFFFSNLGFLYQSLHIPCLPEEVDQWLSGGVFAIQPQPIGELSTEVLDFIFEAILDETKGDQTEHFLTCVFLAISCKRLLSVGKRHILRALVSRYARAADCRIICLGEYANKDDQAPPGMLTDAEIKELETTKMPYERGEVTLTNKYLEARCLYTFASKLYTDHRHTMQEQSVPIYAVMDRICKVEDWYRDRDGDAAPERDLHMLKTLTGAGYYGAHAHYPAGPNVLCNMSKGECVRETALVELQSRYPVTLAHAALSRICYSQDPSMAMACSEKVEKKLVKGPWAGDRLRITSADDMPPLHGDKEWKDVTAEVNRMLRHLWRANDILSDDEDESEEEEEEKEEETEVEVRRNQGWENADPARTGHGT